MSYVYKFIDYRDKIIYIGKTNNIEYRIKQHFSKNGHLPKKCYEYAKEIWFIEVNGKTNVDIYETFLTFHRKNTPTSKRSESGG